MTYTLAHQLTHASDSPTPPGALDVVSATHRPAHGAPIAVVHAAGEAAFAEGVTTRRRNRLKQQLEAQDALTVIPVSRQRQPPLPAARQQLRHRQNQAGCETKTGFTRRDRADRSKVRQDPRLDKMDKALSHHAPVTAHPLRVHS